MLKVEADYVAKNHTWAVRPNQIEGVVGSYKVFSMTLFKMVFLKMF